MFIAAQICGFIVFILNIIAMQMDNRKHIIFMFSLINLLSAINFFLLGGYSGGFICIFAVVQILINNHFEKVNKPVPRLILSLYIIVCIVLGSLSFHSYIDIIPIICSIIFTVTVLQKKEKTIRQLCFCELVLWVTYEIMCMAYTHALADFTMLVSTIIGMYRFDFKKKQN